MNPIRSQQETGKNNNSPMPKNTLLPHTQAWGWFGRFILAYTGALFFLAGIICFFARNWQRIPPFGKFGVIAAALLISAAFPLFRGICSTSVRLGLLSCGILGGILMAVYGQVYQTGANSWTLFRSWAFFLIPLVLISRQTGLWFMLWLVSSLSGMLYLIEYAAASRDNALMDNLVFYQCLAQTAFFILWETAPYFLSGPHFTFLRSRWMSRATGTFLLFFLTFYLALHIGTIWHPPFIYAALLYLPLITGIFLYYRKARMDLFMTAAGSFSLIVMALFGIAHIFGQADTGIFFFCMTACLITGSALSGKYLVACNRKQRISLRPPHEKTEEVPTTEQASSEKRRSSGRFSLSELQFVLKNGLSGNPVPQGYAPDKTGGETALPWQTRLLMGACAWIAVPCLTALALYLFPAMEKQGYILLFLLLLAAGLALTYCPGIFLRQIALCLCLTGACTASILAGMETGSKEWAMLPAIIILIVSIFPAKSHTYRFLAATLAITLFLLQADIFFNIAERRFPYRETVSGSLLFGTITATCALFYVACGIKLASFWRHTVINKEWKWRQQPLTAAFFASPLLFGLLFILFSAFTSSAFSREIGLSGIPIHMAGIGAVAGLGYLIFQVSQAPKKTLQVQLAFILVCLPPAAISWYMPWLGIGLLLLAMAYQAGSLSLSGIALLFMAVCTVLEYYAFSTTLLVKSFSLCGIGLFLLAGAAGLHWYRNGLQEKHSLSAACLSGTSLENSFVHQDIALTPVNRLFRILPSVWIGIFLLFFALSVHQKEKLLENGQRVILALRPLDPRSLMQGNYMRLSLDMESEINRKRYTRSGEDKFPHDMEGTVIAAPDKNGVFHFARFDNGTPLKEQEVRLVYRLKNRGAQIGPGSFFLQEGQEKVFGRARFAELRADKTGGVLLACLLDENRQRIHAGS